MEFSAGTTKTPKKMPRSVMQIGAESRDAVRGEKQPRELAGEAGQRRGEYPARLKIAASIAS